MTLYALIFTAIAALVFAVWGRGAGHRYLKSLLGSAVVLMIAGSVWIDYTGYREAARCVKHNREKSKLEKQFLQVADKIETLSDGTYSVPTAEGGLQLLVSKPAENQTSVSSQGLTGDCSAWVFAGSADADLTSTKTIDELIHRFYDPTNGTYSAGVSAIQMVHYVNTTLPAWRRTD